MDFHISSAITPTFVNAQVLLANVAFLFAFHCFGTALVTLILEWSILMATVRLNAGSVIILKVRGWVVITGVLGATPLIRYLH